MPRIPSVVASDGLAMGVGRGRTSVGPRNGNGRKPTKARAMNAVFGEHDVSEITSPLNTGVQNFLKEESAGQQDLE